MRREWLDLDGDSWATVEACDALSDWWDSQRRWMDGQDRLVPAVLVPALNAFQRPA
jgi:hypothetical protein